MEVVVLCVAESNEGANDVDERCVLVSHVEDRQGNWHGSASASETLHCAEGQRTPAGSVLAHVLLLVATEKTLGLNLRSSTTGELLVEAHDLLHADGIGGGADSLRSC